MLERLRSRPSAWAPPPYRVPERPFDEAYARAHRRFVGDALESAELRAALRDGGALPEDFGIGLDERVVEYPWLAAHAAGGPALDAGSTLNHAAVLDVLLPELAPLTIATLRPEPEAFTDRGISYVYADLRDLPLRDGRYRTVICASTLEHVGMDNSLYGAGAERAEDPDAEVERAMRELLRVVAPGGTLLITVPYGAPEDHGWFRQLDRAQVEALAQRTGAPAVSIDVFAYAPDGWQRSDLDAAGNVHYYDAQAGAAEPAPDRAAAARAIACVRASWS